MTAKGGGHTPGKQAPGKKTGGTRDKRFAQNVKTAHKRSLSSTLWLQRQLNDPYVMRAKEEGWRSRAAYKLIEIDEKYKLLKPGHTILDLGCAPGGWTQYAAKRVKTGGRPGIVIGIDILPVDGIPDAIVAEMDFTDEDAPERLLAMVRKAGGDGRVDGVLSDLAANTTGHRQTDHLKIIGLAELAIAFAQEVLKPGGYFLTKLFQGGETGALVQEMKRDFAMVRHVKPGASRADSAELYVLATGFRGST
ncbi:MAG: RlmE family RNA methyltransferase [Beijerinckiaceae bacterium]